MNIRCKVCGEKAAGFHFGAFTCEGCKSFFGRCCNNMSLIGECRNNKECVIDKKNRTACKACRLRKCLIVGMSKNGSRYGRRSNWFKQFFQETENHTSRIGSVNSVVSEKPLLRERRVANAIFSSPTYFARLHERKVMSTDLYSSTSIPSHLYFNYFQHHNNSNRFISYGTRETQVFLPTSVPLTTFLHSDVKIDEYVEKLLEKRSKSKECVSPGHDIEEENTREDCDDPLDLSQKQNKSYEAPDRQSEFKKSTALLHLSGNESTSRRV